MAGRRAWDGVVTTHTRDLDAWRALVAIRSTARRQAIPHRQVDEVDPGRRHSILRARITHSDAGALTSPATVTALAGHLGTAAPKIHRPPAPTFDSTLGSLLEAVGAAGLARLRLRL